MSGTEQGGVWSSDDALAALRIQIEWGADEALDEVPVDRTRSVVRLPDHPPRHPSGRTADAMQKAPVRLGVAVRARRDADAAATPDMVRDALSRFTDCPLAVTATSLVFAEGNPASGLVLVGDTPGPEEDQSGIPMAGPEGEFLNRMLASIGLDRTHLLITSAIPWRPPGGRAPSESEIAMCLPFLLRHLTLLNPRIVVTLGALPARLLTGSDASLRKLRGKWLAPTLGEGGREVKLLPMLHPAQIMRSPAAKKDAWTDLLALRREIDLA